MIVDHVKTGDLVVSEHKDLEGTGIVIDIDTCTLPSKLLVMWDTGMLFKEWEDEVRLVNGSSTN